MATLMRFDPFREVAALQTEMGRLMSGLLEGSGGGNGGQGHRWVPALDVWETDDALVYAFDLPGIPEDKISIELEDNVLTVSAERERTQEVQDERFYRYERRFGTFQRAITLPQGVKEDDVKADFKDGVLEIHVPKPEQSKPRRIPIGSSETGTIEG